MSDLKQIYLKPNFHNLYNVKYSVRKFHISSGITLSYLFRGLISNNSNYRKKLALTLRKVFSATKSYLKIE
jgi:hypothetical protein